MDGMSRRTVLSFLPLTLIGAARAGTQDSIAVYKDPGCGCCTTWVELLRREGFAVTVTEGRDIGAARHKFTVPAALRSCHTGIVNDRYVVEGHVPPADISRMLKEKSAVLGLAVPGMPIGSPGMEVKGMAAQAYNVIAFTSDGKTSVFASH